jgi:hypothetical protein
MAIRYSHCLRPSFTNNINSLLQRSHSINIIAPVGYGRKRLLEDIKNNQLKNTKILLVDIKEYLLNYDGLIQTLWQQVNGRGKRPTEFEELIVKLETTEKKFIFLLYNFDDLLHNAYLDKKFNFNFFEQLHKITLNAKMSLLCVTNQPYDQSVIFINGKTYRLWFDLKKKRLPKLTHDEIKVELRSRNLSLSYHELSQVTWAVHNHDKPYGFLNFCCAKIKKSEDKRFDISLRIQKWTAQFSQQNGVITIKQVSTLASLLNQWKKAINTKLSAFVVFWGEFSKFVGQWFVKKKCNKKVK